MARYVAEFMRARSERSKRVWRERWKRGEGIGKKGIEYLKRRESRERQKLKRAPPVPPPKGKRWVIEDPIVPTRRRKRK